VSKNNTVAANLPPTGDPAGNEDESQLENEEDVETTAQLNQGRQRILDVIRNLFLTQNQVVLMGDWNGLKNQIVEFMENLHAKRLETDPTYTAVRNGAT